MLDCRYTDLGADLWHTIILSLNFTLDFVLNSAADTMCALTGSCETNSLRHASERTQI